MEVKMWFHRACQINFLIYFYLFVQVALYLIFATTVDMKGVQYFKQNQLIVIINYIAFAKTLDYKKFHMMTERYVNREYKVE